VYCVDSHGYYGDAFSSVLFSAIKKYQKITAVKPRLKVIGSRAANKTRLYDPQTVICLLCFRSYHFLSAYFSRRVKHCFVGG
jgi:hypothetical protein